MRQSCLGSERTRLSISQARKSLPKSSSNRFGGRCHAVPETFQTLAEATLSRDLAAVLISAVGGFLLVKAFNAIQQNGILEQVNILFLILFEES